MNCFHTTLQCANIRMKAVQLSNRRIVPTHPAKNAGRLKPERSGHVLWHTTVRIIAWSVSECNMLNRRYPKTKLWLKSLK